MRKGHPSARRASKATEAQEAAAAQRRRDYLIRVAKLTVPSATRFLKEVNSPKYRVDVLVLKREKGGTSRIDFCLAKADENVVVARTVVVCYAAGKENDIDALWVFRFFMPASASEEQLARHVHNLVTWAIRAPRDPALSYKRADRMDQD